MPLPTDLHRLDWAVETSRRDDRPHGGRIAWRFYLIVRACCGSTWRTYLWMSRPPPMENVR